MYQRLLSLPFALLIFVAHLNCVLDHQLFCVSANGAVNSSFDSAEIPTPDPVDSKSCEHSGCICDGATLAAEFEFINTAEIAFGFDFLNASRLVSIPQRIKSVDCNSLEPPISNVPLRALERCAVLQTFLI